MNLLKLIFLLFPVFAFGQHKKTINKADANIFDFYQSRFNIDSSGFHGNTNIYTAYFTDHKVESTTNYAVDKGGRMSGSKAGLEIKYHYNGQIRSKGNYEMFSLLECSSAMCRRAEYSFKSGQWAYYYETGQIMAIGIYKTETFPAHTCIADQMAKRAVITDDWKLYNPDGSAATAADKKDIIRLINANPNHE